jgi:hypothetical protein
MGVDPSTENFLFQSGFSDIVQGNAEYGLCKQDREVGLDWKVWTWLELREDCRHSGVPCHYTNFLNIYEPPQTLGSQVSVFVSLMPHQSFSSFGNLFMQNSKVLPLSHCYEGKGYTTIISL